MQICRERTWELCARVLITIFQSCFFAILGLKPGFGLNARNLFRTGHGAFR